MAGFLWPLVNYRREEKCKMHLTMLIAMHEQVHALFALILRHKDVVFVLNKA